MSRVITFGEIMLRLAPDGYLRLFQDNRLNATFGGAEANVAVSLANFGENVAFISKLPNNAIGQAAVVELRKYGVNTEYISRGGNRVGIYFLEKGASQRGSICIYDRDGSSIKEASNEDFDWNSIFKGAEWFHFTGITPALSPALIDICEEACIAAKLQNIKISCDLNYRSKLWSRDAARTAMTRLCKYVDICIANEEDAKAVFGIQSANTDVTSGKLDLDGYSEVAKQLMEMFNFSHIAFTLRKSISANDNDWSGLLFDGNEFYHSKEYHLRIVDRVGGGDSFSAGLIYSLIHGESNQEAIDFAVAASALKQTIEGDVNLVSVSEVRQLAGGNTTGRIQR